MTSKRAASGHGDDLLLSFERFYEATVARTRYTMLRMSAGDTQLAADVTQEAYLAMWQRWPDFACRPHDDNRKYVLGIAGHKLVDWYRKQDRYAELDDEHDVIVIDGGFDRVLGELAVCAAVRELVDRQPDGRRAVGIMHLFGGMTYREIAHALSVAESTVRTHVLRLRAVLQPFVTQIDGSDGEV